MNEWLEQRTLGTSLDRAKEVRIEGIKRSEIRETSGLDVLVLGDSLLEILFEPLEFDQQNIQSSKSTFSWNLGVRSLTGSDLRDLASHLEKDRGRFEICVVQIPALHLSDTPDRWDVRRIWPGMGLTNFMNLVNPMSRVDHALDSVANIWTGPISRESRQWDERRRGGRDFVSSPHYPEMRNILKLKDVRTRIHSIYGEALRLKEYRAGEAELSRVVESILIMKSVCDRLHLIWPAFSTELFDPRWSPPRSELESIREKISTRTGLPISDFPMTLEDAAFLDSQHIDPALRGEFHQWLRSVAY